MYDVSQGPAKADRWIAFDREAGGYSQAECVFTFYAHSGKTPTINSEYWSNTAGVRKY
jgi:hypothetical protein